MENKMKKSSQRKSTKQKLELEDTKKLTNVTVRLMKQGEERTRPQEWQGGGQARTAGRGWSLRCSEGPGLPLAEGSLSVTTGRPGTGDTECQWRKEEEVDRGRGQQVPPMGSSLAEFQRQHAVQELLKTHPGKGSSRLRL